MKVYTKKNNGLRLLGEGMVFSKKDLLLREDGDNGNNPLIGDATPGDEQVQGASGLKNIVDKKTSENPTADGWSTELGNLNGGTSQQGEASGVIKISRQQLNNPETQAMLNRTKITDPNMQVTVMNNSVTPRRVMDEMRANSVPFTKTELTKFLKSI